MNNKRGDIIPAYVVGFIVLAITAGILFLGYKQLNFTGQIDRTVCHESVVYRATLNSLTGGAGGSIIPLKCSTAKICVTGKLFGEGNCDEFENEENVVNIRVSNNEKGLTEIEKVYAKEIVSCWETMGEGKVSLFPKTVAQGFSLVQAESSCVICSRIAVDESSLDNVPLDRMDVFNYMDTHLVPNTEETYLQKLSDENSAKISIQDSVNFGELGTFELDKENLLEAQKENLPKETAILFMQISAPGYEDIIKNDLMAIVGIGGVSSFSSVGRGFITVVKKNPVASIVTLAAIGGYQGVVTAKSRAVTASKCGDVSVGDEARSGCSVVRSINYDIKDLSNYCSVIESIP